MGRLATGVAPFGCAGAGRLVRVVRSFGTSKAAACGWWAVSLLLSGTIAASAAEPAFTVLADFEDPTFAASLAAPRNVQVGDCAARATTVPARGRGALALEVGATQPGASVACDLTFREGTRFAQADRVVTFYWLNEGQMSVAFRVRDVRDQLYETEAQSATVLRRWTRLAADLSPARLRCVRGEGPPTFPIEVLGYRVTTERIGRQTIFLDDLQVEHRVEPRDLVHGEFRLPGTGGRRESTHIYEPGSTVAAAVVLENRSRERALDMTVDLSWMRPDGSVLQKQTGKVNLPPAGLDYRSTQTIDFSQAVREPGLYRLSARARAAGWPAPTTFETTIAVTPIARLSRGTATFFGLRTNLLREPVFDQQLEISVARDIGVNLLALETPWRVLQPRPNDLDLAPVDEIVKPLADAGEVAAMLVLTEPPEWVGPELGQRMAALTKLLSALHAQFGPRIERYQIEADVLGVTGWDALLEAVAQVGTGQPAGAPLTVVPPSVPVDDPAAAAAVGAFARAHPAFPLVLQTRGDPSTAAGRLEAFQRAAGLSWHPTHVWLHDASVPAGAGTYDDAETVLRCCIRAAASGLGGFMWCDLRDDDSDIARPVAPRGLVRRDFSPRTHLLGYAAAAGQLTGHRHVGPTQAPPESFESALFIGGSRQVAVLLPRPNRVLPATLAVRALAPGDLEVRDFERRPLSLLVLGEERLLPITPRPLFTILTLRRAEPGPKLALERGWLRVPGTVFCAPDKDFTLELDAVEPIRRGYWQLQVPRDAPFTSSFSAAALQAEAGETLRQTVRLTPVAPPRDFERQTLTLRLSLGDESVTIPIEVRRLLGLPRLAAGTAVTNSEYQIAEIGTPGGRRATARLTIYAAWEPERLHLAIVVNDPQLVPFRQAESGQSSGDVLYVGLAGENAERPVEVRVLPGLPEPRLEPAFRTRPEQVAEWRCELARGDKPGPRTYSFSIPGPAVGLSSLARGQRVLASVRYLNDDADGFAPTPLAWGGGLDGSWSATEFRWLELIDAGATTAGASP